MVSLAFTITVQKLCEKVEVDVLGSLSLTVRTVSVDVNYEPFQRLSRSLEPCSTDDNRQLWVATAGQR